MWAALAKKAQDVVQPVDALPQQVVVAVENPSGLEMDIATQRSVLDIPPFDTGLLVLDANAIIKGLECLRTGNVDCIVTIPQVVAEVRDRAARDLMDRLPLRLHVLEPTSESIVDVMEMAARTGDAGAMSRTDIRLCALAVDCCRAKGCLKAQIQPLAPTVNPNSAHSGVKTVTEEMDEDEMNTDANVADAAPQSSGADMAPADGDEDDWGSDDDEENDDADGEWITPANIDRVVNGTAKHDANFFDGGIACVTSDFAMQNTLMHLGVPIIGPRGMRIGELRLWLLRCHACYRLVSDTTKQFCPDCGSGDTLRRVNYVINSDGEKQLFINFKRQISTRGTVYNLPKPRGGKRGTNRTLVLREDQLGHIQRGQKLGGSHGAKLKQALDDDEDELAAFGEAPVRKNFDVNAAREFSSYKKFNVNERKKARAGRRK